MFPSEIVSLARSAAAGDADALAAYYAALQNRVFGGEGHLGRHLGVEVLEVAREHVTMRLPWRPELRRAGDIFHGGAIMALADHVAGCLFNSDPRVVAAGSTGLTTDFNASFLRAAEPGEAIVATGTTLRRGRNLTFMQIDVRAERSQRTIATCRTSYLTVPAERIGA
jgi:1,4-dihydroxy-2-naphthoyl-CoA hydrolase